VIRKNIDKNKDEKDGRGGGGRRTIKNQTKKWGKDNKKLKHKKDE
jgi:hypothetical protein